MAKSLTDEVQAMEQKISQYESQLKNYNKLVETIVKNEFGLSVKDIHKLTDKYQTNNAKKIENGTANQVPNRPTTTQKTMQNIANSGVQMQGKKPTILEQN